MKSALAAAGLALALTACGGGGETPETVAEGLHCGTLEQVAGGQDQMPTEYECGDYTIVDFSTALDSPEGARDYAEFMTVATDLRAAWVTDELFIVGDREAMKTVTVG